jgi:hypothetical protein
MQVFARDNVCVFLPVRKGVSGGIGISTGDEDTNDFKWLHN